MPVQRFQWKLPGSFRTFEYGAARSKGEISLPSRLGGGELKGAAPIMEGVAGVIPEYWAGYGRY